MMKAKDFVSPDYRDKIKNVSLAIDDVIPVFRQMLDAGMPVQDHINKLEEYKLAADKLKTLLEID